MDGRTKEYLVAAQKLPVWHFNSNAKMRLEYLESTRMHSSSKTTGSVKENRIRKTKMYVYKTMVIDKRIFIFILHVHWMSLWKRKYLKISTCAMLLGNTNDDGELDHECQLLPYENDLEITNL